jgi:glutathione synthase/RimK-type ligase-like ATP-grasp enzyme
MKQKRVAIFSLANDFHALIIQKMLEDNYNIICSIIETDHICGNPGLTWSNLNSYTPVLLNANGEHIDVRTLDLIWWRRGKVFLQIPPDICNSAHLDLITNDCRFALLGILLNEFQGVWISDPQATRYAQNKLVQIRVAQEMGFRTPQTLVSQNPEHIREFCAMLDNRVVVKAVKGTVLAPTFTTMVNETMLSDEESLQLCPAIYQEHIVGTRHVRAHCFGDAVYAALIETNDLDWRANLNIPISAFDLSENIKVRLRKVLKALGLKMGIFDLKFDKRDELVWLEVNPQGQFLFIEGLCGIPLAAAFSEFLYSEAKQADSDAA